MKRYPYNPAINHLASLAVAAAFVLLLSNTALAQRAPAAGSSSSRDRDRESGVREHDRQLQVLLNSREPTENGNAARLQAIIEQTREDFERVQNINRELVTTLRSNEELNYRGLTDVAAEIRKRARRLKENISLPPPPDDDQAVAKRGGDLAREEMKRALSVLSQSITSFASNPLFQTPNLIDVQLGAKASRDLLVIIELSGQIKKSAERLSKSQK